MKYQKLSAKALKDMLDQQHKNLRNIEASLKNDNLLADDRDRLIRTKSNLEREIDRLLEAYRGKAADMKRSESVENLIQGEINQLEKQLKAETDPKKQRKIRRKLKRLYRKLDRERNRDERKARVRKWFDRVFGLITLFFRVGAPLLLSKKRTTTFTKQPVNSTIMAGIKETQDVLTVAKALVEATSKSLEDGQFSLADTANYVNALLALPEAISGIENVPEEIKDLDDDEIKALAEMFPEVDGPRADDYQKVYATLIPFLDSVYDLAKTYKK